MDRSSETILALKPVTFHCKNDAKGTPQYGLIAEEVAKVNPDLVVCDKSGELLTMCNEAVNAMLLNEFLKEHRKVERREKQVEKLTTGFRKVSAQLEAQTCASSGQQSVKWVEVWDTSQRLIPTACRRTSRRRRRTFHCARGWKVDSL